MSKKQKLGGVLIFFVALVVLLIRHIHTYGIAVLQPHGTIGRQESHLIIFTVLLSMIVVIPVYIMLFTFAWKYREGNKNARYEPKFDRSRRLESIWWGVPLTIILILGIVTWRSSHQLDPFKSIGTGNAPVTIQVVALQWKWLFIYPQQNIASVNYIRFPVNTPLNFEITSDAPMNSFWIPRLGGQIYAMSGMSTHLNLEASQIGSFPGSSANISGAGFAGMNFMAQATTEADFNSWIKSTQASTSSLSISSYNQLAAPSQNNPVKYYALADKNLFGSVLNKYEAPVLFKPAEAAQ